jgi:hypothetical protein
VKWTRTLGWLGGVGAGALAVVCCAVGPAVVAAALFGSIATAATDSWVIAVGVALTAAAVIAIAVRRRARCRTSPTGPPSRSITTRPGLPDE